MRHSLSVIIFLVCLQGACISADNGTPKQTFKTYGFIHKETTGLTAFVRENGKEVPVQFDSTSNKLAIDSLQALKYSILLNNSDGDKIFVVGKLLPQVLATPPASNSAQSEKYQMFVLEHWYIKTPFTEIRMKDGQETPSESDKINRTSLAKSDFEKSKKFDPQNANFDPTIFTKPLPN